MDPQYQSDHNLDSKLVSKSYKNIFFFLEDVGSRFLRNSGTCLPNYTPKTIIFIFTIETLKCHNTPVLTKMQQSVRVSLQSYRIRSSGLQYWQTARGSLQYKFMLGHCCVTIRDTFLPHSF